MLQKIEEHFVQNVDDNGIIKQLVRAEFVCDSPSELPTADYKEGQNLSIGSMGWDVSTGNLYGLNSAGVWINQETGAKTIQITQHPASSEVEAGESVTFTSAANGSNLTYQWKSSSDGTTYSNISGATSASYTFTAAAADNGNYYQCVFTDDANNTATSNAAVLTVTEEPEPEPENDTDDTEPEQNNG